MRESESDGAGIRFRLRDVCRPTPELLSATAEYAIGDRLWTHSFTVRRLSDDEFRAELRAAELTLRQFVDGATAWAVAVPGDGVPDQ